ncbi:MAG: CHAD domain-containing protein [Oscillochloris sp.]|nr:CHAD domain-containing protein [Oscillochloris sp.]
MYTPDRISSLVTRALALFDATASAHHLSPEQRDDLALAAACYATARQLGTPHPDISGRDAVLATAHLGLAPERRCVIASAVAFQRPQVRRRREPAFLWLSARQQTTALRLSALLLVADALLAVPPSACAISYHDDVTTIQASRIPVGLAANSPALARWQQHIGSIQIAETTSDTLQLALDTSANSELASAYQPVAVPLRLHPAEPLTEGVRRILRHQFERLLAREQSVRDDEDIEDLHQMRVASRRLRASLQVVEPFFDAQLIQRFRRGLRRVAASLGAVRDRDVISDHLRTYQAGLPAQERAALAPLWAAITKDRAKSRCDLLARLDAPRYTRFKYAFAAFLTTPGAGVAALPETEHPLRVRDALGSLLWRRYEELRAFEDVLLTGPEEIQHQARITGKHLRYTIECFAEAIGEPTHALLEPLSTLLSTLGELQDAATARQYLAGLGLADDLAVQAYLSSRDAECETLSIILPEHWDHVSNAGYRGRLLAVLADL